MVNYGGPERRNRARLRANFVISYRIKAKNADYDLSQTKNVSQGGMLITTNRRFANGTLLAMIIRFPLISQKIEVAAEVIDSHQVVKNLIYDTRVRFLDLNEDFFIKLGEFIKTNLKK